jgi:hypothetical protein
MAADGMAKPELSRWWRWWGGIAVCGVVEVVSTICVDVWCCGTGVYVSGIAMEGCEGEVKASELRGFVCLWIHYSTVITQHNTTQRDAIYDHH